MRGIGFWLTKREEIAPDKEAVVDGGRRLSYRQLNRRVNRLARAFSAQGLAQGDRLALLSYNSLECIEVIMASAKLGPDPGAPLTGGSPQRSWPSSLATAGAESLIFDPELQELAQGILRRISFERLMVLGTGVPHGGPPL